MTTILDIAVLKGQTYGFKSQSLGFGCTDFGFTVYCFSKLFLWDSMRLE